jgi:Rieske Fe-S protein
MSDLNRRQFVVAAACAAGACLMCGGSALADAASQPNNSSAPEKVDVGTVADYPKDGVSDKFAMSNHILVGRENGKIFAMSARCTHKGATVVTKNGELLCPKHGSHFDNDGKPTKGPAKAALFRLPISKDANGHIIVDNDVTKEYGEKDWDKADASISI